MRCIVRARELAAAGVFVCLLGSCKDQGPDQLACQQTYGFGNYGCSDVAGTVLDAQNHTVANASVTAGDSTDVYDHILTTTDSLGKFSVRLLRRWIRPGTGLDTVSTWFHAAMPGAPTISD